jgi:hypothetical protein
MFEIRKRLIDKAFVHKERDENVLIYNVRRALPVKIEENILKNIISPKISESEKQIILEYYVFHQSKSNEEPNYYIMYHIPHIIEIDYVINVIDNILSKEEAKDLLKYYIKDSIKQHYVLKKDITEEDEIQILNLLKMKDLQLIDYDNRERLANIFEKVSDFQKNDLFFANMFADREHAFFFEHSIEHVPAMMIIEATRQFLIAISHIYGKIQFDGTSFILNKINIKFDNYLELNYPIKMMAKIIHGKKKKNGMWRSGFDISVEVYQKNNKAATVSYEGKIIKKEVFDELRRSKKIYKEYPRFIPNGMIYRNILLKDINNSNYTCRLNDISEKGFQVEFKEELFKIDPNHFKFATFFQGIGFINGECEMRWYKKTDTTFKAGFMITNINNDDLHNLKEGIKKCCFIRLDRDYL